MKPNSSVSTSTFSTSASWVSPNGCSIHQQLRTWASAISALALPVQPPLLPPPNAPILYTQLSSAMGVSTLPNPTSLVSSPLPSCSSASATALPSTATVRH